MKMCSCCGDRPADSSRRNYCRECARTYQREWARQHRGSKPRPVPPRPLDPDEKFCPRCKRILTRDYFFKETRASDGLSSICKGCEAFRQQVKRLKRPATTKKKQRIRSAAFRAKNPGYNARACRIYALRRKARQLADVMERNAL